MSYEAQASLRTDGGLQSRSSACVFEQAVIFRDDQRPDVAALAKRHLRDSAEILTIWAPVIAAAPGFADRADDTSQIQDNEILASVQSMWPGVARAFYQGDGTPIEGV